MEPLCLLVGQMARRTSGLKGQLPLVVFEIPSLARCPPASQNEGLNLMEGQYRDLECESARNARFHLGCLYLQP